MTWTIKSCLIRSASGIIPKRNSIGFSHLTLEFVEFLKVGIGPINKKIKKIYPLWTRGGWTQSILGCFRKKWVFPPNHPLNNRVSMIFTIHFGGNTPIFGSTPISINRQLVTAALTARATQAPLPLTPPTPGSKAFEALKMLKGV